MLARFRGGFGKLAFLVATALLAAACETGGLLVVEGSGSTGEALPPVIAGSELVNGGNFAKNGQYKLFYVVGQPTPNQNVGTSTNQRVNGGLVGSVH